MSNLSKKLKWLRSQKGTSQKELALFLHRSVSTISNYETGLHEPDYDTLVDLANFYGVTVSWLLGQTGKKSFADVFAKEIHDGYTVKEFLRLLDYLSQEDKACLAHQFKLLEEMRLPK